MKDWRLQDDAMNLLHPSLGLAQNFNDVEGCSTQGPFHQEAGQGLSEIGREILG